MIERKIIDQEDLVGYDPDNRPKVNTSEELLREISLFEAYAARPIIAELARWRERSFRANRFYGNDGILDNSKK